MITQEQLKETLTYDKETGLFKWAKDVGYKIKKGDYAGHEDRSGYIKIGIKRKYYLAHRLAWLYEYGEFPNSELDHINGDRTDNRVDNLRIATHTQNQCNKRISKNNTSGAKGVYLHQGAGNKINWRAKIRYENKFYSKFFDYTDEGKQLAIEWATSKRIELHGEFVNHG